LEPNLAGRRLDEPGNALDQRRFARAILTDQTVHLAAGDRQVDAAESTDARIILYQAADLQQRTTRFVHAHRPLFDHILGAAPALVLDWTYNVAALLVDV
jgi:hypothetical protein